MNSRIAYYIYFLGSFQRMRSQIAVSKALRTSNLLFRFKKQESFFHVRS
jgi:hypothetical protein